MEKQTTKQLIEHLESERNKFFAVGIEAETKQVCEKGKRQGGGVS